MRLLMLALLASMLGSPTASYAQETIDGITRDINPIIPTEKVRAGAPVDRGEIGVSKVRSKEKAGSPSPLKSPYATPTSVWK